MLEWRLKAYRHWLTMKEPTWANVHYPPIDYQKHHLLLRAEDQEGRPKSLDEVDPELLETYEKLGIPLRERETARRRRGGCGVRQRFGRPPRSRRSWPNWASSSARSPKPCRSIRSWCRNISARWCPTRTTSSRRLNSGRLQRRLLLLHPERRALPDGAVHLFPHQRQGHRPVRAHPDHCRRRRLRQLSRRLHRADARHESVARRRRRTGRARQRARSNIRPCRTGIPATRKARAASTTSSPSAASAAA